jgi:hypothetical protein
MDLAGAPQRSVHARAAQAPARLDPEYRDIVDQTVELLQATRASLHAAEPRGTDAEVEREIRIVTGGLWSGWRGIWRDAAQCLPEILAVPARLQAAKAYTEAQLTPELLGAPLWRQAYAKPLGYPGDYVVMQHIYEGMAAGDTAFGKVTHALAVLIGQFVVRRKDLVRQAIAAAVAAHAGPGPCVVVSLGCGPAREVAEFLAREPLASRPVRFILIDQDSAALHFAARQLAAAIAAGPSDGAVRIELRHLSVLRLLRGLDSETLLPAADLVYSAGLLDYFSDRTCRTLTRRLYETIAPGGHLLLGNMRAGTDMTWPLELIADWSLGYRSAENILAWTEGLAGAEIALRTESTGYDYLLSLRKA